MLKSRLHYVHLKSRHVFCHQDNQIKYRIFGSKRKGTILESGIVASNGIIHIINKLMDTVAPTVKSQREVSTLSRQSSLTVLYFIHVVSSWLVHTITFAGLRHSHFALQENLMKILTDNSKFSLFRGLLQVNGELTITSDMKRLVVCVCCAQRFSGSLSLFFFFLMCRSLGSTIWQNSDESTEPQSC